MDGTTARNTRHVAKQPPTSILGALGVTHKPPPRHTHLYGMSNSLQASRTIGAISAYNMWDMDGKR